MSETEHAEHLTQQAHDRLKEELQRRSTTLRQEITDRIEVARGHGDLKENAEYHAAKDEQGHMEGRIRQLEHMLENCEIVQDQVVYTIVYAGDSDDMAERYVIGNMEEQVDGADVISPASPLGAALQTASEGDTVSYEAPNGALSVTVLKVEPV